MPGVTPCATPDWITVDAAYATQMAEKSRLLSGKRSAVVAALPGTKAALAELDAHVLDLLKARPDFDVQADTIERPDGVIVSRGEPDLLARLLQEDLCILQKRGDRHVLTAATLCFPAGWTLSEKIGRPLLDIHAPVQRYTSDVARRVQRLFDGVQAARPIWRANLLNYDNPALFQPHKEADPRPVGSAVSPFERSERQTLFRLPHTQAVVFAIHTTVVRR